MVGPIDMRAKSGVPCLNCTEGEQHTIADHSMGPPQLCLISDCKCSGLRIDPAYIKPLGGE